MTAPPAPTHTVYLGPIRELTWLRCPACGHKRGQLRAPSETDLELFCRPCHLLCIWRIRLDA